MVWVTVLGSYIVHMTRTRVIASSVISHSCQASHRRPSFQMKTEEESYSYVLVTNILIYVRSFWDNSQIDNSCQAGSARNFKMVWLLCGYALEFLSDILKLLLHVVTHYLSINGLDIGKSPSLKARLPGLCWELEQIFFLAGARGFLADFCVADVMSGSWVTSSGRVRIYLSSFCSVKMPILHITWRDAEINWRLEQNGEI